MTLHKSFTHARAGNLGMAGVEAVPDALFARIYSARTTHQLRSTGEDWQLVTASGEDWQLPRARDALRITHIGEHPQTRVVDKYLDPTEFDSSELEIVVDVGAYIGEFARGVGAETTVCVEPDPASARCCRANCPDATVIDRAAWHSSGKMDFVCARDGSESSVIGLDGGARARDTGQVGTTTVADICDIGGITPDLIKIDAEGAEPEVLAGTIGLDAPIVVDVSPERYGRSPRRECVALAESHGRSLIHSHDPEVLYIP